jgi:hypothetical protein
MIAVSGTAGQLRQQIDADYRARGEIIRAVAG